MKRLVGLCLFLSSLAWAQITAYPPKASALLNDPADCATNQVARGITATGAATCSALAVGDVPTAVPYWRKYSVAKLANGTSGCANSDVAAVVADGGNTGLWDATSGGTYSGTVIAGETFTVEVDGVGIITAVNPVPTAAGSGYAVDEVLTLTTGGANATVKVLTIGELGAILTVELVAPGTGYSAAAGQATTASGSGVDATIEVTTVVDTFKWKKGAGADTEDIVMTAAAQALSDGVTVTWAAVAGHTLADKGTILATAPGCWQVNTGTPVSATAGTTDDVVLFQLPAAGAVEAFRVKTSTACTGATTIAVTDLGVTGTEGYFSTGLTYNLKTAAGATNLLTPTMAASGSSTASAINTLVRITTTDSNADQIATGCAFDVWALWGVLP